ncbi:MAG: hypothetical protein PHN31_00020 [Candidatus Gracilibacteria bacterium]|nr:hypothetical protein [Candidatus Gracilibacteria bacterium]
MFEEIIKPETERIIIIPVGTKKYNLYIYDTTEEEEIYIKCEGAGISQPYGKNDLDLLLKDLPGLIEDEQSQNKTSVFQFRLTPKQRMQLEKNAKANGYDNVSEYVKNRCLVNN